MKMKMKWQQMRLLVCHIREDASRQREREGGKYSLSLSHTLAICEFLGHNFRCLGASDNICTRFDL